MKDAAMKGRLFLPAAALVAAGAMALAAEDKPASRTASATATASAPIYSAWPFDAKEAARRQDQTAKALDMPKETTLDLGNKLTLKLILLPAGKFVMGSPAGQPGRRDDEGPQREVTLSRPFYMGVCEVTKGQFTQFVAQTGFKTESDKDKGGTFGWNGKEFVVMPASDWRKPVYEHTDEFPIVSISWNDANEFCKWLSKKTGRSVHLPTEAQWEYACRAGADTVFPWGDSPDDGKGQANAADQSLAKKMPDKKGFSWDDGYVFAAPVGQFKPNAFGLHDMIGDAWEWCSDWYSTSYPAKSEIDPKGQISRNFHIMRGGCWYSLPSDCRSARRGRSEPVNRSDDVGFRVVVDVE